MNLQQTNKSHYVVEKLYWKNTFKESFELGYTKYSVILGLTASTATPTIDDR